MNRYRVYTQYCGTIDIEAETVRYMSMFEAPLNVDKVVFITDGVVIAEFYCENICGYEVIKKPQSIKYKSAYSEKDYTKADYTFPPPTIRS